MDLVVEVAIGANYRLNIDVVKPRASIAIYANDGGGDVTLDVRQNMIKNLRYQFVLLYTVGDAALTAAVEDITSALMDEALPVGDDAGLPLHRFPLAKHGRRPSSRRRQHSRKSIDRHRLRPAHGPRLAEPMVGTRTNPLTARRAQSALSSSSTISKLAPQTSERCDLGLSPLC